MKNRSQSQERQAKKQKDKYKNKPIEFDLSNKSNSKAKVVDPSMTYVKNSKEIWNLKGYKNLTMKNSYKRASKKVYHILILALITC